MGLAYGMATLKAPHAQRAFERAGWRLIGITPGYDQEIVAPGVVRRVYEAVYTKVLVDEASLLRAERHNLTPETLSLLQHHENSGDLGGTAGWSPSMPLSVDTVGLRVDRIASP